MADTPGKPGPRTSSQGVKPLTRPVGPIAPPVYTPGAKTGSVRPTSGVNEPLVTEGMKARQRDIDKKRRVVAMLRQVEAQETEDRWRRARSWILRLVAVLLAVAYYAKVQSTYGNKWPLWTVWIFLGVLILTGLSWLFWYLDYGD